MAASPPAPAPLTRNLTPSQTAALSSALRFRIGVGVLVVLLAVSAVLASGLGAVQVPAQEIVGVLLSRTGFIRLPKAWPQSDEAIIFQIRLPRLLAAALVGTALAAAGVLFKGLFRNPLAGPYVIRSSEGAAFGGPVRLCRRITAEFRVSFQRPEIEAAGQRNESWDRANEI